MQKAVDAVLERNERAEVRQSRNRSCNNSADRVLLIRCQPGILIRPLAGQGNLLALDVLYEYLDGIAGLEKLVRIQILDRRPGHLRYMQKAVYAADIHKRTK